MFQDVKSINSEDFYQLLQTTGSVNIIDVREDDEVRAGIIPDAIHIRLRDIPEQAKTLDLTKVYYIICHSGIRSVAACDFLQDQGYKVVNVEGGMNAWIGDIC